MSINKAQAAALADGFLEGLGSDKSGLQPRESLTQLFLIAGEFVEDAQNNLNASNSNASGKLSASIVADEPIQVGGIVKVDIKMNFYGRFVNKGVRGTEGGTGLYKFKTPYANKNMIKALQAGIATAKKSSRNVNAKKTTSRNEKKNANISDYSKAAGAAVNIKKYGIKPTGFLDKAVVTTVPKVRDRLGAALKIDVINSITEP